MKRFTKIVITAFLAICCLYACELKSTNEKDSIVLKFLAQNRYIIYNERNKIFFVDAKNVDIPMEYLGCVLTAKYFFDYHIDISTRKIDFECINMHPCYFKKLSINTDTIIGDVNLRNCDQLQSLSITANMDFSRMNIIPGLSLNSVELIGNYKSIPYLVHGLKSVSNLKLVSNDLIDVAQKASIDENFRTIDISATPIGSEICRKTKIGSRNASYLKTAFPNATIISCWQILD